MHTTMEQENYPHKSKIHTLGKVLAILSLIALISCPVIYIGLHLLSSKTVMDLVMENPGVDGFPPIDESNEEMMREVFSELYAEGPGLVSLVPEGATEEQFVDTMMYIARSSAEPDLPMPDGILLEMVLPEFVFLPGGITSESTVLELLDQDRIAFESNRGSFRLLSFFAVVYYGLMAGILLWMARAWMRGEPFGRPTILGLRYLGILFLIQYAAGFVVGFFMGKDILGVMLPYSTLYDVPLQLLASGGTGLSSGVLFLIMSWVLEHGRHLKEEQSLTI